MPATDALCQSFNKETFPAMNTKPTNVAARFAARGSVRVFSDKPLENNVLDNIRAAASHAPTTGNMQLYSVVVSRRPEALGQLRKLHQGQPCVTGCQALLTFCADLRRFSRWCELRKADCGFDNAGGMMTAVVDATIFAQQFVAVAEECGLGTVYLGTVMYDLQGFRRQLELPEGVMPLFSIAVGYPAAQPQPSDRLPLEAVVHRESYADPSDADIEAFYAARESAPEAASFIAENNKETLAQVFAEVRYPRSVNMAVTEGLKDFLHF